MPFGEITCIFLSWLMKPKSQKSLEQEGVLSPSHTALQLPGMSRAPRMRPSTFVSGIQGKHAHTRIYPFPLPSRSTKYRLSSLTASWGERFAPTEVTTPSAWWSPNTYWAQAEPSAMCGPKVVDPINLPNTRIFFQDILYIRVWTVLMPFFFHLPVLQDLHIVNSTMSQGPCHKD